MTTEQQIDEVISMVKRGVTTFERGYFPILGKMQREGIIEADLYKEGYAIVRLKANE